MSAAGMLPSQVSLPAVQVSAPSQTPKVLLSLQEGLSRSSSISPSQSLSWASQISLTGVWPSQAVSAPSAQARLPAQLPAVVLTAQAVAAAMWLAHALQPQTPATGMQALPLSPSSPQV